MKLFSLLSSCLVLALACCSPSPALPQAQAQALAQTAAPLRTVLRGAPPLAVDPSAYILMVTFSNLTLVNLTPQDIASINASPYQGYAVPLASQYDVARHTMADYETSIDRIKADSRKDIWPWVFLNRIVGFNPNTSRKAGARFTAAKPYFERIRGMDVDDRTGALSDFYQMFKLSLEVAKRLGVRGIVLDLETYNDYNTDTMPALARMVGTDQATLRARLEQIGSQLATITQQTYPNALIWCFQTGLGQGPGNGAYQTPFTYIVLGLLQNAARQHMALTLIDGGEPWGYCFTSLGELGQQIQKRQAAYRPLHSEFPNLELAGTVAVWINPNSPARTGFWRSGACGRVGNRGGPEFVPDIIYLTQHYHYVWVYAVADFNPLNAAQAAPFNHALSAALR